MHVGMVLDDAYPPDVRVSKEAAALTRAGHRVTVLCEYDGEPDRRETLDGVEVLRLDTGDAYDGVRGMVRGGRYLATLVDPVWRRAIEVLVADHGVDALHVHDLPLVKTALRADVPASVPVVADLHENYPEAVRQWRATGRWFAPGHGPKWFAERLATPVRRYKRLERACVRRVDHVVTVVEEARTHYVEDCGVPGDRVTVVSNTVDLDRFDPDGHESVTVDGLADDPDAFVVTYVGSLSGRHRGLHTVLDAVASPACPDDVHLLVVGSGGTYEAALRRQCAALGLDDRVTFTGWVDFGRVPAYIAASDACLVPHAATPHTNTTVPHKLFQYMAMARPVVVTDVPPLERIVGETGSGLVVPAGDPDATARAFARLRTAPDEARRFGERGRLAVEREYNWRRDADRLLECYRAL